MTATRNRARFVGRYDELARVRATITSSQANGFELLVIAGERGIGKSRLVAKALELEAPRIDRVTRFSCIDQLGASDAFLDGFISRLVGDNLPAPAGPPSLPETWEAELASASPSEIEARKTASLARAVAGAIHATDAGNVVLVVEDLHWATATTLTFLDLLVDEMTASPYRRVAMFVTRRLGPPGDAVDVAVRHLLASQRAEEMVLGPLAVDEEEELVRCHTTDPSRTFVDLVRRTSSGNPLDMLATIDVLRERGIGPSIRNDDPRILGRVRLPLPSEADPVVTWLSGLPADLWTVVSSCAILTDEFDVAAAAAASALPPEDVVPLLDRACELGILALDGMTFWFAHPHYREVLSAALKASSRAEIHLRCLRHIQAAPTGASERDHYAIGHHVLQARAAMGPRERWIGLKDAGAAAIARAEWVEAGRFLEAAIIDCPDNLPADERATLHLRTGQAHFFSHDALAAREHLLSAVDLAKAADDQRTWALAARTLTRLDNTVNAGAYQRLNNLDVIREFLEVATDPVEKALGLEVLAEAHSGAGLDEEADRLGGEAIRLLEGSGDHKALAMCYFAQAYGALAALRLRQARAIEAKVLYHTSRTGDWFVPMALAARMAYIHIGLGDLDGADRLASQSIATASAYHEFAALSLGHAVRAATAMLHGDLADADRHANRGASAARRCGHASAAYHLAPLRTALHLLQGRLEEADVEASAWSGLPDASLVPLRAMVERRRASTISVPSRTPIRHVTWLGAGVLAAQVTNALEAGDVAWLDKAVPQLQLVNETEIVFTGSFPSSIPRLLADTLCAVERFDDALELYARVIPVLRETTAYPDLVRALIGQCRAESRAPGGSRDRARRSAAEALELARRLDLEPLRSAAAALLRRDIDVHTAVRDRMGEWRVILLTDIVGSTSVSQLLGDLRYHQLVMQHHALVRQCIKKEDGREFSDSGDGLYVWFPSTEQAVEAALAIQDETTLAMASEGHRLAIKIALSGGEPFIRDDRPYGLIVNRAARLIELAKGGEIVTDEAVAEDLDRSRVEVRLGTAVELRGIGEHRPTWITGREGGSEPAVEQQQEE